MGNYKFWETKFELLKCKKLLGFGELRSSHQNDSPDRI